MEKLIDAVKTKTKQKLDVDKIEVINNTHKHKHHKQHDVNKLHLKIVIESKILKTKNRIDSQREIMNILKDELKKNIHSLEIEIK